MKKAICVKTKRMILRPMTDGEIEQLITKTDTDDLRAAYQEMLTGCKSDPENREWYAPWAMELKAEHTRIGDLCFKGPVHENAVEIGYGIQPAYEGNGYTTEAVSAMTQWAFGSADVIFVEAETEPDNKASQRVLEKCGFKPDGDGKEGPRFVLEKPLPNWMSIYMLFGLSIGTAIGSSVSSVGIGVGMPIGMSIGLCIGAALDSKAKKERRKLREQRSSRQ